MDELRVVFLLLFLVVLVAGCVLGCRLIINWPGSTPADPE